MNTFNKSIIATMLATGLLVACGGGGGSSTPSSSSTSGSTSSSGETTSGSSTSDGTTNSVNALVVTTIAGSVGVSGVTNGTGTAARFSGPAGITVDNAGNLYVADSSNSIIRKITPAGVVSTLAGNKNYSTGTSLSNADGTGAAALFLYPRGITVDSTGNLYVADTANNSIRKITPTGVVSTLAGSARGPAGSGSVDGTGAAASFGQPTGITVDSAGNLYVADTTYSIIRKITPAGVVSTLAGSAGNPGITDGTGTAARFQAPTGIAVDNAGNLYVADSGNNTIRKITPAGVVSTLAGSASTYGLTDGTGAATRFSGPAGITVDSAGNLYVADFGNNAIRKITPAGVVTTIAGSSVGNSGSTDGTGATALFYYPEGITVDSAGNLYVADRGNHTIRKISASNGTSGSTSSGTASTTANPNGGTVPAVVSGMVGTYSATIKTSTLSPFVPGTASLSIASNGVITLNQSANVLTFNCVNGGNRLCSSIGTTSLITNEVDNGISSNFGVTGSSVTSGSAINKFSAATGFTQQSIKFQ